MFWPTKENYKGRLIPTSLGVVFIPGILLFIPLLINLSDLGWSGITNFENIDNRMWVAYYGLVVFVCLLGLLDDVIGGGQARGFKGHIAALFKGRVTTGLIKAVGGGLAGLAVGWWVPTQPTLPEVILNGLVVALAINVFNLLDLRPGRAFKGYFTSLLPLAGWGIYASKTVIWPFSMPLVAIAAGLFAGDLRERYMLGDAGSNVLGASIGFILMVMAGPLLKIALAVLLVALNLASERWSFSKVIEATPFLKRLDEAGRRI
ncbi:MAG: hypothetical protein WC891_07810 [Actinomycetota bacterium]